MILSKAVVQMEEEEAATDHLTWSFSHGATVEKFWKLKLREEILTFGILICQALRSCLHIQPLHCVRWSVSVTQACKSVTSTRYFWMSASRSYNLFGHLKLLCLSSVHTTYLWTRDGHANIKSSSVLHNFRGLVETVTQRFIYLNFFFPAALVWSATCQYSRNPKFLPTHQTMHTYM